MGLLYNTYLNSGKIYGCKGCKAHLANHEDIISRVSMNEGKLPWASISGRSVQGRRRRRKMPRD